MAGRRALAKASGGLSTYRRALERAAAELESETIWPRYSDGSPYRSGDVVPEGEVLYARHVRAHEHPCTSAAHCHCPEPMRLVLRSTGVEAGGTIRASSTMPIRH